LPKVKIPNKLCLALFPNADVTNLTNEQEMAISKAAKEMISDAANEKLALGKIKDEYESEFAFHKNISFPQNVDRPIKLFARRENEVPSRICLRLLISAFEKGFHVDHISAKKNKLSNYLSSLGYSHRHHQDLLFDYMDKALSNGKCGIIEGGTGIGKTLAIFANANEVAKRHEQRVVIATNSISNIHQYVNVYNDLIVAGHEVQPVSVILGQSSFVSVDRLTALVEESEYGHYKGDVREWLKQGARSDEDSSAFPSYQIASIEKICPDLPITEISLRHYEKDDPGMLSYRGQFNLDDHPSAIILCTHAMLCIDAKRRVFRKRNDEQKAVSDEFNRTVRDLVAKREEASKKTEKVKLSAEIRQTIQKKEAVVSTMFGDELIGVLPQYEFLIVDEAHLLEQAMSDALSERMSFKSVVRSVKALSDSGLISEAVYKKTNMIANEILAHYDSNNSQIKISDEYSDLKDAIRRFCTTIIKAKGIKEAKAPFLEEIKRLAKFIDKVGDRNTHLMVNYSPLRHYPQAIMGMVNTHSFLSALWNQTTASCCVSATLYFKKYLEYSASYFIDILNIPDSKCMTFEPITPRWMKEPIKDFFIPSKGDTKFYPADSSIKDPNEYADKLKTWQNDVANKIVDIHRDAVGGTLVLMTSFADVKAIAEKIQGNVDELIYADGFHTLSKQKEQFIEVTKKGRKPVWLALGGAWTGLDINGKDIGLMPNEISEKDNVITDLVIPKIPFGLNMTLAHTIRKQIRYNSGKLEILDTAIRTKQGLGRIVRLEGQPKNRRIFMLDARIHDPKKRGFYSPIIQLIETYPNVKFMDK